MRCEAVHSSTSQMRGREACLRSADPATGVSARTRCPGCYRSPQHAGLGDPGDHGDLGKIGMVAQGDFTCASIGSLFEGCLLLLPSKSGSRARLPPNLC